MHDLHIYQQVARLHAENINQGFLASLGAPFLALLYEAIDANDSGVLLIVQRNGQVVGFLSAAEGMRSIYRQLLRRWLRLVFALLPALVSPRKLWKIAEILLLSTKNKALGGLPNAELLSLAVAPAHRRAGDAGQLFQALVNHFGERDVKDFRIVVGERLASAHCFYTKMGALAVGRIEVHGGEPSVVYVKSVCQQPIQVSERLPSRF